ncbi:MAG: precorrin-6Y C5,15-methyltransferase (decarboxylating) subunit CbiT, partial [Gemmataceae bacterium]
RREVRLIALGYLELHEKDVLWDIGAGSGSVSIEASRLLPSLRVFAVERSAAALEQARANAAALGANGITFVEGTAPDVLHPLPDPGAVFLGGSGGKLEEILDVVIRRLRPGGRLVVNCVTLENFTRAWDWLTQLGWQPAVTQVQLAHSGPLGRYHAFESDRPVFIIRASRPTP